VDSSSCLDLVMIWIRAGRALGDNLGSYRKEWKRD
jgi:hypothetical protein